MKEERIKQANGPEEELEEPSATAPFSTFAAPVVLWSLGSPPGFLILGSSISL
jgi:hypothetical protein